MPFSFVPQNSDQTSVAVTTGSAATLLAARVNRLGFSVWNDASGNMYLELGTAASSTKFTAILVPGAYFESPFFYAGIVTAILASGSGNARIQEMY